jgi:hypothetical protein
MKYGEIRGTDLDVFAEAPKPRVNAPKKVNLDPEKVEQGLTQLVLSLLELIRQLVEKQALRRIEGGSLSPDQVERVGTTLLRLEEKMQELKAHFKISNLNIDLGPLGSLLDDEPRAKSSQSFAHLGK